FQLKQPHCYMFASCWNVNFCGIALFGMSRYMSEFNGSLNHQQARTDERENVITNGNHHGGCASGGLEYTRAGLGKGSIGKITQAPGMGQNQKRRSLGEFVYRVP